MQQPSCEQIAEFINSNLDTIVQDCSAQITPDQTGKLRDLVADWVRNLLNSLQGKSYRAGEWASHFSSTAREMGLSSPEAFTLLDKFRISLTGACKQFQPQHTETEIRICLFEASEIFKNHLVEYYLHQADEEAAAGLRKQKAALEASASPMAVLDEQGRIEIANREMGRLLKTGSDALTGTDFYSYCTEETAALLRASQRKKTSSQQPLTVDGSLKFTRTELNSRFNLRPVFDTAGHRSGTVVCLLPESRPTENVEVGIQYLEDHILTLLSLPVQVVAADHTILYNSEELLKLSLPGYDSSQPICCYLKQHQRGSEDYWFCKTLFEQGHFHWEEIHFECDGETRWFHMLNFPLTDGTGSIVRMVTCVYDTTRRRQIQKQMESHLIQQQRSSLVSQIAVTVAHQLRNPLSVVLGFAEMLSKGLPPDQYSEAVNRIHRNSLRCKDIVENLLDFGKGTPLERRPVDFENLIQKTVRIRLTPAQDRLIEWRFSGKPTPVECVPEQLAQVVHSLLQNALKVAHTRILFSVEVKGYFVRLRIVDDGPGIPISDRERVFEPFYTSHRKEGAVGLGLSLARALANDYGGSLTISTPGAEEPQGACFIFQLPLLSEPNHPEEKQAPETNISGNEHQILIVDDNADLRDLLTTTLYNRGFQVTTVTSGMAGLEKLKQQHYDAIILDFLLEGSLTGRQIYEEIQVSHPEFADKVLFITGDMLTYQTRLYLESTHRPVLEKPFLMTDFLSAIAKIIQD